MNGETQALSSQASSSSPPPSPPYEVPNNKIQRSSSLASHTTNLQINLFNRRRSLGNSPIDQGDLVKLHHLNKTNHLDEISITISQQVNESFRHSNTNHRPNKRVSFARFSIDEATTESPHKALKQLIIPFLLAGLGNVSAGVVLDYVQHWPSFTDIKQFLILVPALLGLKGNVEMTLASRLSTHANLGNMNTFSDIKEMVLGNMALVQCQASTVGIIAPIVAILLSLMSSATGLSHAESEITFTNCLLVMSSSVITTNLANLLLGTIMCTLIVVSNKLNINPGN